MKPASLFVLVNFLVAAFSDVILNFMSRSPYYSPAAVKALRSYFGQKVIVPAFWAGMTVVIVLLFTMVVSFLFLHFATPTSTKQLWQFLLLAAPLGFIADIIIYKYQLFGTSLNPFYKIAGAGFWGMMAFLFAIGISYGAVAMATNQL